MDERKKKEMHEAKHPVDRVRGILKGRCDVDAYIDEIRGPIETIEDDSMPIKGTAHKFGDHVDTDVIIPARYLSTTDPGELASHCMEDIDANFIKKVNPGDVIVAGRNFGCGSSREHAPISIKAAGVAAVIAATFARIFYRNALNIGLPIIESPEAAAGISAGDQVEVDLEGGKIRNLTTGAEFSFAPLVGAAQDLIKAGGLVELTKQKLAAR